jgi:cbb3-type cytochrome oxidase subunit 3
MDKGTIHGIYTLLFMFAFIAMGIWVYLPRRKKTYDDIAALPMSDTDDARDAKPSRQQD